MTKTGFRSAILSIVVAFLLVSAGCSVLADTADTDSNTTSTASPTLSATSTPTAGPDPAEAKDLRNFTIGDIVGGEIDRNDPLSEQGHYEPVTIEADRGDQVTFLMQSAQGDPLLKVVAPNGTVIASDDDGGPADAAQIEDLVLPTSGEYTLMAMSAEPNGTFLYSLDTTDYTESTGGWYKGDMRTWNESEQFAEYARDFQYLANGTETNTVPINQIDAVNAEQDYVVITYRMNTSDPNADKMRGMDVRVLAAYGNVIEDYRGPEGANESWIPDRVYVREVTPDGELHRTAYVSREMEAAHGDEPFKQWVMYRTTMQLGPAHEDYNTTERFETTTELDYPEMDEATEKHPPDR